MISIVYSSDLIHFSHAHLFKYEKIKYSPITLGYTRIGLGDPNNNSFLFEHCQLKNASTSCFHILKEPNEQMTQHNCYIGDIPLEEIEDHEYMLNEPLMTEKSKNNRVLMSKTNNIMPHFVDNLIKYSEFLVIKLSNNYSHIHQFNRLRIRLKNRIGGNGFQFSL